MTIDPAAARDAGALAEAPPKALRDGAAVAGPMAGLLDAMVALTRPRAEPIDAGVALFSPDQAPERFSPWLAGRLGCGWFFLDAEDPRRRLSLLEAFPPGADRLRAFLAAGPDLHARRATAEGLRRTREAATGVHGFSVAEDPVSLHMTITAPEGLAPLRPRSPPLIAMERPPHMTWSLALGGEPA